MITCPNCSQQLPDWAKACQFCHSDVSKVARPTPVKKAHAKSQFDVPSWVWPCYYAMAGLYILSGIRPLISGIMVASGPVASVFGGFGVIAIALGVLSVVVGLGLILKVPVIRTASVYFNWVKVLLGLMGAWASLLVMAPVGVLFGLIDVASAGFLIYLVAETDSIGEL